MSGFFDRLSSAGLFVLRVSIGSLMLFGHGYGKLIRYAERAPTFPDPLGIGHELSMQAAIVGEVVCPLLVIFGLFTRIGAGGAAFTMMVAAFLVHAGDPWPAQEKAILYAIAFFVLVFTGGGIYSIERRMWDILFRRDRARNKGPESAPRASDRLPSDEDVDDGMPESMSSGD